MKGVNPDRTQREWDTAEQQAKYNRERVVKDIRYYARSCGFDVVEQEVETKDGYLLKVFKVICLKKKMKIHSDGRGGFPVLIQHGLFQSCGSLCVDLCSFECLECGTDCRLLSLQHHERRTISRILAR